MFGFGKKKLRHMDLRDPNFNFDVYARIYYVDSFYDIWTKVPEYLNLSSLFDPQDIVESKAFFSKLLRKYTDEPTAFKELTRAEYDKLTRQYQLIAQLWEHKYAFLGKEFEENFAPNIGWPLHIEIVNEFYENEKGEAR